MKIAILGYGKMGRLVESLALREGWEVGPRLDIAENQGGQGITAEVMSGVDVAVDFTQPDAVVANVAATAPLGIHMVVGTTGWHSRKDEVQQIVTDSGIGLVHASNFSVGVNLFFEIVRHAARVVGKVEGYDPFVAEEHHRAKKDAPSGTALTLLESMAPFLRNPNPSVTSTRAGHIPGNHTIGFDSEADTILLEHRARSRQGFAEGAIMAARWIRERKGFYDFRDVFREILGL